MKPLTIDKVKELLAKAAKKHDRELTVRIADAKKSRSKYRYIPEYKPFKAAIPFRPRLQLFKTSSGKNYFDPTTFQAYSYDWWKYLELKKSKVVFNSFFYSMQTAGHQRDMGLLLKQLGIKIDVEIDLPRGLQTFDTDALPYIYQKIITLEVEIGRKRSNPNLNKYRKKQIKELLTRAKQCRMLGAKLAAIDIKQMRLETFEAEAKRVSKLQLEALQRRELRKLAKTSQGLDVMQFASGN